jgi:hypothetical protein
MRAKRALAFFACVLCGVVFAGFAAAMLEDAFRPTPRFEQLTAVEGVLASRGECSGKGRWRGADLTMAASGREIVVRVPCMEQFMFLQAGIPLKLRFRKVDPMFNYPSYTELWHASSGDRILYSYEARLERETKSRWVVGAVAVVSVLAIGALFWLLFRLIWRSSSE